MNSKNDDAAQRPGMSSEYLFTLLKYTGISFIAGSVNHGTFSEARSMVTAAIGVAAFLLGALFERRSLARAKPQAPVSSLWSTLAWGAAFSVGLGFFTGGLQHFPDSPTRSVWVVPAGFVLAAVAMGLKHRRTLFTRTTLIAMPALGTAMALIVGGMFWFYTGPGAGTGGHTHDESAAGSATSHDHADGDHADAHHDDADHGDEGAAGVKAVTVPAVPVPTTTAHLSRAAAKKRGGSSTPTVTVTRTVTATHQH